MTDRKNEPSNAEFLASLVTGSGEFSQSTASVQRSHRFPVYLFWQIENLARMGQVPVSVIINQLVECGLDAVKKELPEDALGELSRVSKKQSERRTVSESIKVTRPRGGAKPKMERGR